MPATITVGIDETRNGLPSTSYTGKGTLETIHPIAFFTDKDCKAEASKDWTAAQLREGVTFYVKGSGVGAFDVTLRLAEQDGCAVQGAKDTVKIDSVNVITPVLEPDPIALVHKSDWGRSTSLSELKVRIEESDPGHPCKDLQATLSYGGQIACYKDDKMTEEHASGKPAARAQLPDRLLVKGMEQGECEVTLKLSSELASSDKSWKIAAGATKKIWVEKLEIDAYQFREGKSVQPGYETMRVTGTPKARELHNKNDLHCRPKGPGEPSVPGRFTVKKPSDRFWECCEAVLLEPSGHVTVSAEALRKADFKNDEREVIVTSHGPRELDAEPTTAVQDEPGKVRVQVKPVQWNKGQELIPGMEYEEWKEIVKEKKTTDCYVSCGAKIGEKRLLHTDVLKLETYTFDVLLDGRTKNECGRRVREQKPEILTKKDVALACAGGHLYYDLITDAHVNKVYDPGDPTKRIFDPFIEALASPGPNKGNSEWADAGVAFIADFLEERHKIDLHAATKEMIKGFLLSTLDENGNRSKPMETRQERDSRGVLEPRDFRYGFDAQWGVPGLHAEVLAVNALLNRGLPKGEVTVATYKVIPTRPTQGKQQGRRFKACPNCAGILVPHVRVITG